MRDPQISVRNEESIVEGDDIEDEFVYNDKYKVYSKKLDENSNIVF